MSESVDHGDVLVASPTDDGTAIAQAETNEDGHPVVGMALEDGNNRETVLTLVGGPGLASVSEPLSVSGSAQTRDASAEPAGDQTERIDDLEAENERLCEELADAREEIADKDERIAALEDRLDAIESQVGTTTPADD